jgi:tetratricopeptide (TPR) repeat protein/predicted Ser/Thr protein kinase
MVAWSTVVAPDWIRPVDAERHQRVSELFAEAVALPPGARAAFIASRCGADAALRAELESLLDHHDAPNAAIATAALDVGALVASSGANGALEEAGEAGSALASTGRFRIVRLLGEGGMGTVYLAEQERPRRTVALKVMRAGLSAATSLRRRFELEAEVLGRLEHPGIARIYDAGTAEVTTKSGTATVPYFAMEYVDGLPLVDYVRQAKLGTRARMELVAKIAEAVGVAHRRGIVHRDIKPANVLVDRTGQPKVLDFGVARATDSDLAATTVQTDVGQLVGTLAYMSPEQISGDSAKINPSTDVYALGALAYELLAGRPLVDAKKRTVAEIARQIQESDAPTLSSVDKVFRGDLDTIVAKALEKEQSRRYADADALASDIRRYLADEPIVARPATTLYQLGKFARRNRVLVGGICATFVVLVLGLVGTSVGVVQAMRERDAAITAQKRADERFQDLHKLANTFIYDVHDSIVTLAGSAEARKKIVTTALQYLDRLASEAQDDVKLMNDLSEAYIKVGQAQGYGSRANLGDTAGAIESFRKAESLRRRMLEVAPTDEHRTSLSRVRNQFGILAFNDKRYDEALAIFDEALAVRRDVLSRDPENRGKQRDVAIAHQWRGNVLRAVGEGAAAGSEERTKAFEGSLDAYREQNRIFVALRSDAEPTSVRDVTVSFEKIGDIFVQLGRLDEAIVEFRKSLAIREEVLAAKPNDHEARTDLVSATAKVGNVLMLQGRLDDAEPLLRRSRQLAAEAVENDPTDVLAKQNKVVGEYRLSLFAELRAKEEGRSKDERLAFMDEAVAQMRLAVALLEELERDGKIDATRREWLTSMRGAVDELLKRRDDIGAS